MQPTSAQFEAGFARRHWIGLDGLDMTDYKTLVVSPTTSSIAPLLVTRLKQDESLHGQAPPVACRQGAVPTAAHAGQGSGEAHLLRLHVRVRGTDTAHGSRSSPFGSAQAGHDPTSCACRSEDPTVCRQDAAPPAAHAGQGLQQCVRLKGRLPAAAARGQGAAPMAAVVATIS